MSGKTFEVTIVSKQNPLWKGEAFQAQVPALGGGLTFLADHASAFVLLSKGQIKIKAEKDLAFSVEGGFSSFEENKMVMAVDSGEEDLQGNKPFEDDAQGRT